MRWSVLYIALGALALGAAGVNSHNLAGVPTAPAGTAGAGALASGTPESPPAPAPGALRSLSASGALPEAATAAKMADATGASRSSVEGLAAAAVRALGTAVARTSDPDALRIAFRAYYAYRRARPGPVRKPYLYFVDYGLSSRVARGYVFDMDALRVVEGPFAVAHGRGSASSHYGVPTRFSNASGSAASSLGLYLAQESYSFTGRSGGRSYHSIGLRLEGLSGRFNSRARARGVVVHGAPYVTTSGSGRSEGCPAMSLARARRLIPLIANGGVVFLYSPRDAGWLHGDPWVNAGSAS